MSTPRRQETPPNEPGLWILYRLGSDFPWPFIYFPIQHEGRVAEGHHMISGANPTPIRHDGDVWEGPFLIPQVDGALYGPPTINVETGRAAK